MQSRSPREWLLGARLSQSRRFGGGIAAPGGKFVDGVRRSAGAVTGLVVSAVAYCAGVPEGAGPRETTLTPVPRYAEPPLGWGLHVGCWTS